jgi:hypothetical protein
MGVCYSADHQGEVMVTFLESDHGLISSSFIILIQKRENSTYAVLYQHGAETRWVVATELAVMQFKTALRR